MTTEQIKEELAKFDIFVEGYRAALIRLGELAKLETTNDAPAA